MSIDYKSAGVDIEAGTEVVNNIKPAVQRTRTPEVLSELGLFGGFYDARFPDYEHPVLVSSTDGVGTKLKVATMANKHNTVGECLVNHCVNDILACGAKPIFYLDYFATGRLDPQIATDVIIGMARGCENNGCALIGGETAEMPSMYADGEYDLAGTIVGVVEKEQIINGSAIVPGDVLIGLPSSGLHTNGYSLARAALFPTYAIDQHLDELGTSIGDALLAVHKTYAPALLPLIAMGKFSGLSHITGGGIVGNTSRILPENCELDIDWTSWKRPPIFSLIQQAGDVSEDAMRSAFNLGIGMIAIVRAENVDAVCEALHTEQPVVMGSIVAQS